MSSTAILAEIKSDSLQYLAVLSLNRISISEFNITPLKLSSCSHNSNKTLFWHFLFPGHKQGQVYFFQDILHTYLCTLKIPTLVWFIEKNKKNVGNIKEQQSGGTVCYVPLMLCK